MKEAKEVKDKPDWDASTTATKNKASAEDRMASKIAAEVLKENAKLRGVHSKESIKAILESNVPYSVTVDCACAAEAKAPNAARANSDFFIRKSPCDLKNILKKTTSPKLEE